MKNSKKDMPPAGLILGIGHESPEDEAKDDEHDIVAPDDYDTGDDEDSHEAASESIRAIHARDPEGHADGIHQMIDARLRHHGILKDHEPEDDAEEEGKKETTGKGSSK